ncbi:MULTISPECIES: hypothetical protein [unclassified Marinobacter]|uniref:hypothetical protein n=1 Tax=unclassified Marinobacter TaxID=83889 RepID=UPI001595883F|nr:MULTISPECIES: hypothetical protein [unclassified Marinobacter]
MNIRTLNTLKIRLVLSFGILILAATTATIVGTWATSDLAVNALRKSTRQNPQEVAVQLRDKIELDLHERYSDLTVAAALSGQHRRSAQRHERGAPSVVPGSAG